MSYIISGELDFNLLQTIINEFTFNELPKLNKYWNYYLGNQEIMRKVASNPKNPLNKVVVNFCQLITETYNGYLTGQPIRYNGEDISNIIDILNYNDVVTEDTELLQNALIFGVGYEVNYIDGWGQQRFKTLDPRTVIPVYDDSLDQNLKAVIRFYASPVVNDTNTVVEVYYSDRVDTYTSNDLYSSFELVSSYPHYFKQVPITVFPLNKEQESIYAQIISLQDAYNNIVSGELDVFDQFADSYLVLKGVTADSDDVAAMREDKIILLDDDADAFFLTKNLAQAQAMEQIQNIQEQIYKVSLCPDFASDKFAAQTGIALKYKLIGFENRAAQIANRMRQALQRRIELINAITNLTDMTWRDIDIIFTRNLPENVEDYTTLINGLRGVVSDRTLLAQVPFIDNVDDELAQVKQEQAEKLEAYSITTPITSASGANNTEVVIEE